MGEGFSIRNKFQLTFLTSLASSPLFRKHSRHPGDGDEEQERLQSEAECREQLHAEVPGGDVGSGRVKHSSGPRFR